MSRFLRCALLALLPVLAVAAAPVRAASAVAAGPGGAPVKIAGQPDDVSAARAALAACEREPGRRGPCELIRLNDEVIRPGEALKARVPAGRHPLFLWQTSTATARATLAGSIHLLKPSLFPLPPAFEAAFARADHLVVEVDAGAYAPGELQRLTRRHALLPAGTTLNALLKPATEERLAAALTRHGLSSAGLAQAKPGFVSNQLAVARLMALGYLPEFGMEQHFLTRAGSRRIVELESLESQLRVLFDQPLALQVELLEHTLAEIGDIEATLGELIVAWLAGDDGRFLELFKAQSGDSAAAEAFNRAVLDDRNRQMAAEIQSLLTRPGDYFVLVGAAHFVGDNGFVKHLQRGGLRVDRLYSDPPAAHAAAGSSGH